MVSLFNISFLSVLMVLLSIVHAKTVVGSSNNLDETKSAANNQLYEIYKAMRTDPRFASVTNEDIVAYIYQNYVLSNDDDLEYPKPRNHKQRRQRHRKINHNE